MSQTDPAARPRFLAFLSHKYKAPEVNIAFYNLFREVANVEFDVDRGKYSTNVTRLERMIRDAHAFIGVYPFGESANVVPTRPELLKESRYFRLELDLAVRSGKPAIVFHDSRYRDILDWPRSVISCKFNARDIGPAGELLNPGAYRKPLADFCQTVRVTMDYRAQCPPAREASVGIAVPAPAGGAGAYSAAVVEAIRETLADANFPETKIVPWPPVLGRELFELLQCIDWMVVDVGAEMAATGLPSYLHGRFVPMMRLKHVPAEGDPAGGPSPSERTLFGGVDVGYDKDIVRWGDADSLVAGLRQRLLSFVDESSVKRFAEESAAEYFWSAALRKGGVFLSYCNEDRAPAADLSAALKRQFKDVFDYRDAESLPVGRPWVEEVFERLSASAVGVLLLSADYFKSGNCAHEMNQMVALRDAGKMTLFPVKLYDGELELPAAIQSIQYMRYGDFPKAEAVVEKIIRGLPPAQ